MSFGCRQVYVISIVYRDILAAKMCRHVSSFWLQTNTQMSGEFDLSQVLYYRALNKSNSGEMEAAVTTNDWWTQP